jgi:16S rRNA (cytosine967-C5)-methyltransferase
LAAFLQRQDGFDVVPSADNLAGAGLSRLAEAVRPTAHGLQMTPLRTGTDGFYVAVLRRR